ncbi:hypothetical protein HYC85_029736 [Camellia sinensis]|uniref:Leucine-rich repeat-containing N-terminal plant-type domain-containing protein n=1 Tax=Camellia sinensis TaxID=4442 RepID=A0A7J7FZK1_CAMSI|nr:hypothetical protein HYC85_029736 [Camellia sinensis]
MSFCIAFVSCDIKKEKIPVVVRPPGGTPTINVSIPDKIGILSKLMYLDLSYNYYLQGLLPLTLGNLTQLLHLNMSNTDITGTIPSSIGQLTNLIFLCLSSNPLNGTIPPDI